MLDTNIVSAILRDPRGAVAQRIAELTVRVSLSVVVAGELRYGAARRGSPRLTQAVERVISTLEVVPLQPPVDQVYGALRHALEQEGRPMDANDLLIAAHALHLRRILVSDDHAFRRVAGLRLENWLR